MATPGLSIVAPHVRIAARVARISAVALVAIAWLAVSGPALAQDKAQERLVRRLQLQLQSVQQQLQEAQSAKTKAEADKAAAEKQLTEQAQQLGGLKGALGKSSAGLKTAETERAALGGQLAAANAAFEKQSAEQKRSHDEAIAAKNKEMSQLGAQRDQQLAAAQKVREEQTAQIGECTGKNERLVRLGAELLDRYRKKTVADVLKQQDPVLGLGDVKMFNLVQEYRDKADAERYVPPPTR